MGPKNNVLDKSPDSQGKQQCLGLSAPLKSIASLCCGVCKDSSTSQDAVWELTHVDPRKTCIRWGQSRTNPFVTTRGDKKAMQPFIKIH